jgi:ATP-dependent helicase/DNAse subunit B
MSVEFYIGRPATGKTQTCVQRVRDTLSSQPLSEVWVIVPDRLQATALRQRLAQSGGVIGAHIGTFGDLYRNILERAGNYIPVASAPLLHTIIQEVVALLSESGELIYYAPLRTMPGFFLALRDSFAELKRSLVFPEQFVEFSQEGTRAQQELARVYLLYQTRLRELGWADSEGLSWLAVELLESHTTVAKSIRMLAVDGFDSFTGAQRRALQLLAGQVGELLITFPGERDSQRLAHRRFTDTMEKLIRDLSPHITTLAEGPFLPPDILHLENSLFEPGDGLVKNAESHFLLETRSPADEAREALRWIKAHVVRDGIALSDCAIFTPNPDVYNPFLRASAEEFGIPAYFSQVTVLAASLAIAALLNLLALPAQNFKTRMLFNALRSPYFEFGLDSGSIDVLEEISRKARIIEGQEQWLETWERLSPTQLQDQPDLDDERRLPGLPRGEQAQSLQRSLQICFDVLAMPTQSQSQTVWVSWLEDLLDRLGFYHQADNERDELACEVLRESLRAMVLSETVTGERLVNYASFLTSLQSTLNGAGLPEPRLKGQPALLIGRMVEARGVSFKAVVLLGFSEGIFPEVERTDPFLDEPLRQALGLEQRLNREQAGLFYQAVTRTDQYLLITRPYLSDDGENWEASPFWEDVQKRFDKTALKIVRPDDVPSLNDAASSQELLFWAVRHKKLPGRFSELEPRWEALRHARDILHARRAKEPAGAHEGVIPELSQKMTERYPLGSVWSTSRLEAYGNCPHQFYVKVALGLEPRTIPELGLDVSQLGTLLHKVLEEAYSTAANPNDVTSILATLPEIARKVFEDAPMEYGFRPSTLWEFEQAQLLSSLQQTIEALNDESVGWTPMAYEQKFGIGDIPPLEIDLGAEKMRLRGVIDRLDHNEDGDIRVVDYKTGSSHLESKDLKSGARLQLPLYAMAAQETLHRGHVVEGFYWKILAAEPGALKLSRFKTEDGQGVDAAIQVVTDHLSRILAGIRSAEFPPIPPKGGCPTYCPVVQWCWRYQPGWGGAK